MYNYNPYDPYGMFDDDDEDENIGITIPDIKKGNIVLSDEPKKKDGECTCPDEVWMNSGCKCGAIERYKLRPSSHAKHYI